MSAQQFNDYAPPADYDYLWTQLKDLPYFRALLRAVESRFYRDLPMEPPILDLGSGDGLFAAQTFARPLDVGIDPFTSPTYGSVFRQGHKATGIADGAHMPFPMRCFRPLSATRCWSIFLIWSR